jgi:hypothetical protein
MASQFCLVEVLLSSLIVVVFKNKIVDVVTTIAQWQKGVECRAEPDRNFVYYIIAIKK